MPVKPEHRQYYSKAAGWGRIRLKIMERAKNHCEWCGVANRVHGYRDERGRFYELSTDAEMMEARADRLRIITIVCTVAHVDQNPTNNDPANLAFLCQRCHLTHDAGQHARSASRTRAKKREIAGQTSLFGEPLT